MNQVEPLISNEFKDIYYSREGALEEKKKVFLNRCVTKAYLDGKHEINIIELGFGLGINYFLTAQRMEETFPDIKCNYRAVEKFPLNGKLLKSHLQDSIGAENVGNFFSFYPDYVPENNITFLKKNFNLEIIFSDVIPFLENNTRFVDIWYMDGFSPKLNPEMWSETIVSMIQKQSKPTAILATYSSAGFLQKLLINFGFKITLNQGFGKKKTMIFAEKIE